MLSFAAHAINLRSELISWVSVLSEINEGFPLVNISGIYFSILFSVEAVHRRFDYIRLPVDITKGGNKT